MKEKLILRFLSFVIFSRRTTPFSIAASMLQHPVCFNLTNQRQSHSISLSQYQLKKIAKIQNYEIVPPEGSRGANVYFASAHAKPKTLGRRAVWNVRRINCAERKYPTLMTYDAPENENVSRRKGDRKHLRAQERQRKVLRGWREFPGGPIVRNTLIKNPFPGYAL